MGDLVGALMGPLVGPLVAPLVDPLVGRLAFACSVSRPMSHEKYETIEIISRVLFRKRGLIDFCASLALIYQGAAKRGRQKEFHLTFLCRFRNSSVTSWSHFFWCFCHLFRHFLPNFAGLILRQGVIGKQKRQNPRKKLQIRCVDSLSISAPVPIV